jgi:hypothetical protein
MLLGLGKIFLARSANISQMMNERKKPLVSAPQKLETFRGYAFSETIILLNLKVYFSNKH